MGWPLPMKESKNYNVEEGLAFDVWYNRDLVWYNDIIDMSRFEGVFYHEQYRATFDRLLVFRDWGFLMY
jgi:hypothetical protein